MVHSEDISPEAPVLALKKSQHEQNKSMQFIGKIFPQSNRNYQYSREVFVRIFSSEKSWKDLIGPMATDLRHMAHPLLRQVCESFLDVVLFYAHHELAAGLEELKRHSGLGEKFILNSLRSSYLKIYPHPAEETRKFFYLGKWIQSAYQYSITDFAKTKGFVESKEFSPLWKLREFEQILTIHHELLEKYPGWQSTPSSKTKTVVGKKTTIDNTRPLFYGWWGKVFRETFILLFIFLIFIFAFNKFSKVYQSYLLKEIASLEINHSRPETKLVFKTQVPPAKRKVDLAINDFDNIKEDFTQSAVPEFVTPETDMLATNIDLGQNKKERYSIFSYSNSEDDFRDTQYGFHKSYRLLVKSSDIFASKSKMLELVKKFGITPVTNELVGNEIPGGVFFNLHVPTKSIETFVKELNKSDAVSVYISKSSRPSPRGMEKVFVWMKEI